MAEENTVPKLDSIVCPIYLSGENQWNQRELMSFDYAYYGSILISLQVPFAGDGEVGKKRAHFKLEC